MKKHFLVIAALLLGQTAFAAGTVVTRQFFSDALGETRSVQVYTPDGYVQGGGHLYPTIYYLHHANGSHLMNPGLVAALNQGISEGSLEPVIVVSPNGLGCVWGFFLGCGWVNSVTQGNFEDFVVDDVVAWTEAEYDVAPSRDMRAIMGGSMGAFGSMHAALKHPDVFAAVASHSGYLDFSELVAQHQPVLLSEQGGPPPWTWTPTSGLFISAWFLLSGGFSPDPGNPPYLVDFPLDSNGAVIPAVMDQWFTFDPMRVTLQSEDRATTFL